MGQKSQVEPGYPSDSSIGGTRRYLPNAMILWTPVSAHLPHFAIRQLVDSLQNHRLTAQAPLDRQQLTMVGDPALMPDVTRGIVNSEALASMTVRGFINLVQDASVEYQVNARATTTVGRSTSKTSSPRPRNQTAGRRLPNRARDLKHPRRLQDVRILFASHPRAEEPRPPKLEKSPVS